MKRSIPHEHQELYLVIEGLSGQLSSLVDRLAAISEAPEAEALLGVDALYRADKDLALLCLRYDEMLGPKERRHLIRLACHRGIPVLDPRRLCDDDRELFYHRHLSRYAIRLDDKETPSAAIDALGRLLGIIEARARSESGQPASQDDVVTRVGSSRLPSPSLNLESMELGPAGVAVPSSPSPRGKGKSPTGKRRAGQRMPTIPARPANTVRASEGLSRRPRASTGSDLVRSQERAGGELLVRFERGDRWMPARLRNLTLKQIRLAASAAPPLGTSVRVCIERGNIAATLPGIVVEVVNTEKSVDGSTSFRVEIRGPEPADIQRLTALLRRARMEGLELSPPPPRKNRRFSVTWPIAVLAGKREFRGSVLDISEEGLFLSTDNRIHEPRIAFGIPLDTVDATVQGRARIAREVSEEMAVQRNLSRGYGLHFEPLSKSDSLRYENFLVRVCQRSEIHVLVASETEKGSALASCFQSAGYTVTQTTSVASAMTSLDAYDLWDKGRPDVAVLDETDLDARRRAHVEGNLEGHRIPILRLQGQVPTSARHALDRLMSV